MPTIINPKFDLTHPMAHPIVTTTSDNVVILEIDNLLSGWPTYVLDYVPENPGPIKFLLRLKDVKKYVWISDDEDSDGEEQMTAKSITSYQNERKASISIDLTNSIIQNNSQASSTVVCATPVELHGTLKDLAPQKIFDEPETVWPPAWPRVAASCTNTVAFGALRTRPVAVKAVEDV